MLNTRKVRFNEVTATLKKVAAVGPARCDPLDTRWKVEKMNDVLKRLEGVSIKATKSSFLRRGELKRGSP